MKLEINQKVIANPARLEDVQKAVQNLKANQGYRILLAAPDGRYIRAIGSTQGGFVMHAHFSEQEDMYSPPQPVATEKLGGILISFARGEEGWQTALRWQKNAPARFERSWKMMSGISWFNLPVGLWAFVIFSCAFSTFAVFTFLTDRPGAPAVGQIILGFLAIGAIAFYIQWVEVFFRTIRPLLQKIVRRTLGIEVVEDLEDDEIPGSWNTSGNSGVGQVIIPLLDGVILMIALIGPVALICIPTILVAEFLSS